MNVTWQAGRSCQNLLGYRKFYRVDNEIALL